jgi:hypothetical protein
VAKPPWTTEALLKPELIEPVNLEIPDPLAADCGLMHGAGVASLTELDDNNRTKVHYKRTGIPVVESCVSSSAVLQVIQLDSEPLTISFADRDT